MPIRALLAALLALPLLTPAGLAAAAEPVGASALLLAQADRKRDDEDERKRSKQPERGERSKDAPAAKAPQREEQRGRQDRAAEAEKAKREAAEKQRREREAAEKAARESRDRGEAERKARAEAEAKARAEAERKARTERDAKERADREARERAERDARAKQQQQTQERDRDRRERPSAERRRGGDEERQARERAQQREQQRTSAQELSKVQVQPGGRAAIDGGRRTLEREGNRVVIRSNDTSRLAVRGDRRGNERVERLPNNQTRTIVVYPDGTQIITITDARGAIVHRSRRGRDGREVVFFREVNRPPLVQLDLGPLRLSIPREHYIVDSRRASRADLQRVFWAPPVERVDRIYTIDEVRRFDRVRDIMPRLDFHTITFDTDSALISPQQVDLLADIADIIHEMIDRNPAEVILIEGHTDAPGSEIHNLALSDRRAEAVAIALTDYFDVPPENLVTQGYGESFLKIPTEAAERENRRVAFRRITPLVSEYGR